MVFAAFAPLALAFCLSACGTVDPGPPTGPPMGCNGSPAFFVSDVWPKYLDKFGCGKVDCHDSRSGHSSFRLQDVSMVPTPGAGDAPSTWPDEWRFNYVNATRQLNCSDPLSSRLLVKPEEAGVPHQGGKLVTGTDADAARTLFVEWAGK